MLPYSSGTTGLPKGVMLSHTNLVANIGQIQDAFAIESDDTLIGVLPFFHIYGMTVIMNQGLRAGATIVTMPRFDLDQFLGLIAEHGVTRAYVVPPIALALAKHPAVDKHDLSSMRTIMSGAAPLGAELAEKVAERLDCTVIQGYGLTETSPVTHVHPPGRREQARARSARRCSSTECRLVDPETGEDVGEGERGELWVRGPQVMQGYLNNEEASAATVDADGWLHTGDIAVVDSGGLLRDRRSAQGADQVQGLPGRSGRARGADRQPPAGRRRGGDRRARRGGRRAAEGLRGRRATTSTTTS